MAENAFFWMSRGAVPLSLFVMYKRGIFEEFFQLREVKMVGWIVVMMYGIELTGHAVMKYMSLPVYDKYVGINEAEFAFKKKKATDDYLVQKNYFR